MQTQGKNLSSMKAWATSWLCLVLTGCSWLWGPWLVHPVTSGSHSIATQCWRGPKGPLIYAVWSARPIASQYVAGELLQRGNRVVERARLEQLFAEQHFQLLHATEADLLRIGHMAGATQMIFIDITTNPASYVTEDRGYTLSVTVRSVIVETGELCWSGTASTPDRIMSPLDESIRIGTYWAWARATCPVEAGYRWVEQSSSESGGCKQISK